MANSGRTTEVMSAVLGILSIGSAMAAGQGDVDNGAEATAVSAADSSAQDVSEVVVTGYRNSLRSAVELKKSVRCDAGRHQRRGHCQFPGRQPC